MSATLSLRQPLTTHSADRLPLWQHIILLTVIGYEALGCLSGGALLVAAPDGRYMDMPVDLMNGAFQNFLIPGIILFCQGILNTVAFIAVLRKKSNDWFLAALGLGGLVIWFTTEILILQELHWLHLMWGLPVLLGWFFLFPLIALRNETLRVQCILLSCGIVVAIQYILVNVFVPTLSPGYNWITTTVSELSAVGSPTRIIWVLLATPYPLLYAAFGWGILKVCSDNKRLKWTGVLILAYSFMNLYWPPMHQREVIAAGGGTISDTLHIAWAMATLAFMFALMVLGASSQGKGFRYFTVGTFLAYFVFGILTGMESGNVATNGATPHLGLYERMNILAFMIWTMAFSIVLLKHISKENVASNATFK